MSGPAKNTDRELYREDTGDPAGSYYENSLFVTESGAIGMNVGGSVIVQPIADWHRVAMREHLRALSAPLSDEQGGRAHGDGTAAQGSAEANSGGKR